MKKKILILLTMILCVFSVACGKGENKEIANKLIKNVNNLDSYYIEGELEIINNEDIYMYTVKVSYQKPNNYKVELINTINNHIQVLLKNEEGVYVLTPSLNKSFKFQSDWPYNNSQVYLLQSIAKDIENDSNYTVDKVEDDYIITCKVNYANNPELIKQKIIVDKNATIKEIQVINKEDNVMMKMKYNKIEENPTFNDKVFILESSLNVGEELDESSSKIDTIIYPMYLPANTHLQSQDKLTTETGERVILTFGGEKSFVLIQETVNKGKELVTIPTYGDPIHVVDSLGALTDSSVNWYSNGIEYYVKSDSLSQNELLSVASSISVLPVGK